MSLQSTLDLITQAQKELTELVEEEQQNSIKITGYAFIYEQYLIDTKEWGLKYYVPHSHNVQGAFRCFGDFIDHFGLIVRNMNFGKYEDMQEHLDRVDAYWREQRNKAKEQQR